MGNGRTFLSRRMACTTESWNACGVMLQEVSLVPWSWGKLELGSQIQVSFSIAQQFQSSYNIHIRVQHGRLGPAYQQAQPVVQASVGTTKQDWPSRQTIKPVAN